MATITVTNSGDTFGDQSTGTPSNVTLRQAINFANANPGTTITFAANVTTVTLAGNMGLIYADGTVIDGGSGVIIDGAGQYRPFFVSGLPAGGTGAYTEIDVTISDISIRNVLAKGGNGAGGGGGGVGMGGGVFVNQNAHVVLNDVSFAAASAQGGAGSTGSGGGGGGIGGDGGAGDNGNGGYSSAGGGGGLFYPGSSSGTPARGGGGGGITSPGSNGRNGGSGGLGIDGIGGGGGAGGSGGAGRAGGLGAQPGTSSDGGNGGFGGGGGGAAGNGGVPISGDGGFGGGGGGKFGGAGGFGGGGGGGTGNNGGFGGGGGSFSGEGGFGAGDGSKGSSGLGGGGGGAFGGAIFVAKGGTIAINGDGLVNGVGAASGGAGGGSGGAGIGYGAGIFVQGGPLKFGAGTYTVANVIADQAGSGGGTEVDGFGGTGGVTSLVKNGNGSLILSGANTYSGGTSVLAGRVIARDTGDGLGTGDIDIGAAGTLELNVTTGTVYLRGASTYTGAGTIQKTGTGTVQLGANGGEVSFALAKGGLIEVKEGTLVGSNSFQGLFTDNKAGLTIATDSKFDGVEGEVVVDGLNGGGTLSGGWYGAGSTTIGIADGSGTFSGTIKDNTSDESSVLTLIKVGTGRQTLSGANTYTGATTIQGGTLQIDGSLTAGSAVTVARGAAISGDGTAAGSITVSGTITANLAGFTGSGISYGSLTTGALTLTASAGFVAEIGTGANDQILVKGAVVLDGSLDLRFAAGFSASRGTEIVLIDNGGTDGVTGRFANYAEGRAVTVNGRNYAVTYQGGDGNDVALTALNIGPEAANDVSRLTQWNSVSGDVLANDTDRDGDRLAITKIAFGAGSKVVADGGRATLAGRHGTLIIESDGDYSYVADGSAVIPVGDTGADTFTYTTNDRNGGSDTATLTLTVTGASQGTSGDDIFYLTGRGTNAAGGAGNDTYFVDRASDTVIEKAKQGVDTIEAGASYVLAAKQEIEILKTVSDSAKTTINLTGNEYANTITGNAGANTLDGKLGSDVLVGGTGKDTFFFSTKPSSTNLDHIADFRAIDDTIQLENAIFTALKAGKITADEFALVGSKSAIVDADAHILYEKASGTLYYDPNGGSASGRIAFAVIDNHTSLTFQDFQVA